MFNINLQKKAKQNALFMLFPVPLVFFNSDLKSFIGLALIHFNLQIKHVIYHNSIIIFSLSNPCGSLNSNLYILGHLDDLSEPWQLTIIGHLQELNQKWLVKTFCINLLVLFLVFSSCLLTFINNNIS